MTTSGRDLLSWLGTLSTQWGRDCVLTTPGRVYLSFKDFLKISAHYVLSISISVGHCHWGNFTSTWNSGERQIGKCWVRWPPAFVLALTFYTTAVRKLIFVHRLLFLQQSLQINSGSKQWSYSWAQITLQVKSDGRGSKIIGLGMYLRLRCSPDWYTSPSINFRSRTDSENVHLTSCLHF